ncbi:MAG: hypothetical protein HY537_06720 [Deltaproteobacteria bacterium]|nr:hypothetical protein [Deltaproteobacteria bacterium]
MSKTLTSLHFFDTPLGEIPASHILQEVAKALQLFPKKSSCEAVAREKNDPKMIPNRDSESCDWRKSAVQLAVFKGLVVIGAVGSQVNLTAMHRIFRYSLIIFLPGRSRTGIY